MTITKQKIKDEINELIIKLKEAETYYLVNIQYDVDLLTKIKLEELQKDIQEELNNQCNLFKKYGV